MEFHVIQLAKKPENDEELLEIPSSQRIFADKAEALKNMKKWKTCNPRLKTFNSQKEAELHASELIQEVEQPQEASNESCPFKGLTPQELKKLKEAILNEDESLVRQLVASNPRFLMTPCDQPAIIHSGTRSNALHFASAGGKLRMAQLVLELITDPSLIERMYPRDSPEAISQRQEYLLDLYLNMNRKGDLDTPLHQASKWGHWQIVELLVNFSSCDTKRVNRDGATPADVACSRSNVQDADIKRKIMDLLADRVYIPVCLVEDHSMPSYIGDPLSPAALNANELMLTSSSPSANSSWLSPAASSSPRIHRTPMPKNNSPLSSRSPRILNPKNESPIRSIQSLTPKNDSPIISPISVKAYLGPISPIDAEKVRLEWRKQSPANKALRLTDPDKGLERQGRLLAKKYKTTLNEYWPFLNSYCDITSNEGLQMLENHLIQTQKEQELRQSHQLEDDLSLMANELANLNLNSTANSFPEQRDNDLLVTDINSNGGLGVLDLLDDANQAPKIILTNNDESGISSEGKGQPLSNSFLWNQPRNVHGPKSDSSLLDNSVINGNLLRSDSFSSEASENSFVSAASSLNESVFSAEEGIWTYINGDKPSKADLQVYHALSQLQVDPMKFPSVHTWKCLVDSTDATERLKWTRLEKTLVKKRPSIPRFSFDD